MFIILLFLPMLRALCPKMSAFWSSIALKNWAYTLLHRIPKSWLLIVRWNAHFALVASNSKLAVEHACSLLVKSVGGPEKSCLNLDGRITRNVHEIMMTFCFQSDSPLVVIGQRSATSSINHTHCVDDVHKSQRDTDSAQCRQRAFCRPTCVELS